MSDRFTEQTNPGPLGTQVSRTEVIVINDFPEIILIQDPHIRGAIMFGRGRFQNGVLVDPKPQYAFDSRDQAKLEKFRNAIWSVFARLSARCHIPYPWLGQRWNE